MNNRCNKGQTAPKEYYFIFPETGYHIDCGHYHTYGIQLSDSNIAQIIHDVSTCEETVSWITGLLNYHQVFPCHFKDVVEDLIL